MTTCDAICVPDLACCLGWMYFSSLGAQELSERSVYACLILVKHLYSGIIVWCRDKQGPGLVAHQWQCWKNTVSVFHLYLYTCLMFQLKGGYRDQASSGFRETLLSSASVLSFCRREHRRDFPHLSICFGCLLQPAGNTVVVSLQIPPLVILLHT